MLLDFLRDGYVIMGYVVLKVRCPVMTSLGFTTRKPSQCTVPGHHLTSVHFPH